MDEAFVELEDAGILKKANDELVMRGTANSQKSIRTRVIWKAFPEER